MKRFAFHPLELLRRVEVTINRPFFALPTRAEVDACFEVRASTDVHPETLIVLTTYARATKAAALIEKLGAEAPDAVLFVLHDACGTDYSAALAAAHRAFPGRLMWLDAKQRLGKPRYWVTYQEAFFVARELAPARTLFIQDDVAFEAGLLSRAKSLFDALAGPRCRVLYLFATDHDAARGQWIHFARRAVPGVPARLVQWFDLQCFLVDREFFALLDHRIVPVHPNRFVRNPTISSGVGRQLTRRLFGRADVYQAWPTLVFHGGVESEMNPEARKRNPLDNRR